MVWVEGERGKGGMRDAMKARQTSVAQTTYHRSKPPKRPVPSNTHASFLQTRARQTTTPVSSPRGSMRSSMTWAQTQTLMGMSATALRTATRKERTSMTTATSRQPTSSTTKSKSSRWVGRGLFLNFRPIGLKVLWRPIGLKKLWRPVGLKVLWRHIRLKKLWRPIGLKVLWRPISLKKLWRPVSLKKLWRPIGLKLLWRPISWKCSEDPLL